VKPGTRKLILLAAVVLIVVAAATLMMSRIPEEVSGPLFVLVVIVEVIVAPIPGGAIGYMGAARFGFWQAWPLLYIGNAIGTTIVFFLARRVGGPLFEENVSRNTRERYDTLLRSNTAVLWLLYSIPLIPVDVLSVLAGLSSIQPRRFLTIALTGYVVYTAIVAYIGAFVAEAVGVTEAISVIAGVLFLGLVVWWWRAMRPAPGKTEG
jgi:uncharacterized membrane protein YdjX (TVP38/TMEM64 family)